MDALIIGSGIAGISSALELADKGLKVTVLTKEEIPIESNSRYAQGGIVYKGKNDNPKLLYNDIMKTSAEMANPQTVEIAANEGPNAVYEILIKKHNVPFNKDKKGETALTEEGAHSDRRILYIEDITGKGIMTTLLKKANEHKNIKILTKHTVVDLIMEEYHTVDKLAVYTTKPTVLGAYVLDEEANKVRIMLSKYVIIATGGMGQVFLHTTNARCSTGDGYAIAYRAGAKLINMEYTQFHPTTLYHEEAGNFLISEAVRGEGAEIIAKDGMPFMKKYHEKGSLAPRDIVSQAILTELISRDDDYVLLDCSPIPRKKLLKRFPNIVKKCAEYNIDVKNEAIPVVPAFHFACGGIRTDMFGRTNVYNLYAIGEVACSGLHGANRLASTSLFEAVLFAKRAADKIEEKIKEIQIYPSKMVKKWQDRDLDEKIDPALIQHDWVTLKSTMWNYVGIIRSERRLRRAIHDLKNLLDEVDAFYRNTKLKRPLIEIRNAIQTALVTARSAYRNKQSIGCHYRTED